MAVLVSLSEIRRNRKNRRKKQTIVTMTIGEMIRRTRVNNGLSQDSLGRRTGYSQSEISRIENDEISTLIEPPKTLAAIFRELGSNELVEWYLTEVDPISALWREWNEKKLA